MPRALNLLRSAPHYRRDAFDAGLRAAGFEIVEAMPKPARGDLLLIWNRYSGFDEQAHRFEQAGAQVLVAENCPLGNEFRGGSYSLASGWQAMTGGHIVRGAYARWDGWGIDLQSWHKPGGETVILGQRSIGHSTIRSPFGWAETVRGKLGGRVRQHPGKDMPAVPLEADLSDASNVVTWSSAAAVQALMLGVPVWHAHPHFVGASAARPLREWPGEGRRDDDARLELFRRLAWAMWSLEEIASGAAVRHVSGAA